MTSSEFKAALDYCIPVEPSKVGLTYRTMNRRGEPFTPNMEEFYNGSKTGRIATSLWNDGKFSPKYLD